MYDSITPNDITRLTRLVYALRERIALLGSAYVPAEIVVELQEKEEQLAERIMQRTQQMFDAQNLNVSPPPVARGVITAVSVITSTQKLEDLAAFQAINYHRAMLRHCWLIATSAKNPQSSEPTAQELKRYFEQYQVSCNIYEIENGADPIEMRQIMTDIYHEIEQAGEYTAEDLICDITSGTKAMTIGMALACGSKYRMQYLISRQQGFPSLPMLIKIDE
jgi:hypothetical protein